MSWTTRVLAGLVAAVMIAGCTESPTQRREQVSLALECNDKCPDGGDVNALPKTTTAVDVAPAQSVFGQPVTFTATVAQASGAAVTGTVTFYEFSGTQTCADPGTASALGVVSTAPYALQYPALGVGTHAVTACFDGGVDYIDSGASGSVTVAQASTTTALTSAQDPANSQVLLFTATVSPVAPGAGTPSGTVTLYELATGASCAAPGTALGAGQLSDGKAAISVASLTPGSHTVTACYGGDASFTASDGSHTPTVAKLVTITTVRGSTAVSVSGQGVMFSFTVKAGDTFTSTGTLTLRAGGTNCEDSRYLREAPYGDEERILGYPMKLNASQSPFIFRACYADPKGNTYESSEASVELIIEKASTVTTLTSTPTPSPYGQGVQLSGSVAVQAPGTPGDFVNNGKPGSTAGAVISFRRNDCSGTEIAQVPFPGFGVAATTKVTGLAAGAYTFAACFTGSVDFAESSKILVHQVSPAPLKITASSGSKPAGQSFTVQPSYDGFITGEGIASLTTPATCTSAGSAANAAPGVYETTCTGAVAPNYAITYQSGSLTVTSAATTLTLTPPSGVQYSDKLPLMVTVGAVSPVDGQAVTGTVDFYIDNAKVGSGTVSNGVATLAAPNGYAAGSHSFSAQFQSTNAAYQSNTNTPAVSFATLAEDATITPATANVGAIPVSQTSVSLTFQLKETSPEPTGGAQALPGDLNKITGMTATLGGVATTASYNGSCTLQAAAGSAYTATRQATCTFTSGAAPFTVDAYTVSLKVGGTYYTGSYDDALAVYDPAAGFVNGGGKFIDADGLRVSFGMSFTYTGKGKTGFRGGWVVIKHMLDGSTCRVKSNTMNPPSVSGTTATLSGKSNYACISTTGVTTTSAGNLDALGYVEDNGTGGSTDRFWIRAYDKLLMPTTPAANARVLTGGNIQVPKP